MCLIGFSTSQAQAVETHTIIEALKLLDEKLKTDPKLKEFRKYTSSDQFEIDRALAEVEFRENLYTGSSKVLTEVENYDSAKVSEFYTSDQTGESALTSGGSTDLAVGSEAEQLAVDGGLVDTTAAVGGLLPLAGFLVYEDISTGTNPITTTLFGSTSTITSGPGYVHDLGITKARWVRFPEMEGKVTGCSGFETFVNCANSYEYEHSYCSITGLPRPCEGGEVLLDRFGIPITESLVACYQERSGGCQGEIKGVLDEYAKGERYWLEFQVEGTSNWSVTTQAGRVAEDVTGTGATTTGSWLTPLQAEATNLAKGCNPVGRGAVTGFPNESPGFEVIHGTPERYFFEECKLGGLESGTKPGLIEFNVAEGKKGVLQHKVGLPHIRTPTEVKKLEEENRIANKLKGVPVPHEGLPESIHKTVTEHPETSECNYSKLIDHFNGVKSTKCGRTETLPGTVTVPDCTSTNILATTCRSQLESEGFEKVEIEVTEWKHAVITKPADDAIKLTPGTGSVIETSTKVVIEANPKESGMPAIVPSIKPGEETGTQYKERIEREGWTKVEVATLPETATDPHVGPSQAAYTSPAEGTGVDPCKCSGVTVEQNPTTAPAPESGGSIGKPTLPGFKFPNFGVLCKGFPFGVPCWLWNTISSWSATAVVPEWGIEEFTIMGHKIKGFKQSLARLEPIMEKVRPAMVLFCTIGILLLFYRLARGGSPATGTSTDTQYNDPSDSLHD